MLSNEFETVVRTGWKPRMPATEAELAHLQASIARGTCLEPLVQAGDELYTDPDMTPEPGDLVQFELSRRGAQAQNSGLPPGLSPSKPGDLWTKLFHREHGFDMLMEKYGHSATATLLNCESPDDTPKLSVVRQIIRRGKLLYPVSHSSQIGLGAATVVASTTVSSATISHNGGSFGIATLADSNWTVLADVALSLDSSFTYNGLVSGTADYANAGGGNVMLALVLTDFSGNVSSPFNKQCFNHNFGAGETNGFGGTITVNSSGALRFRLVGNASNTTARVTNVNLRVETIKR